MAISRDDRARQFLPFDSLKGFNEALRQKEIEYDERKELFEEEVEEIQKELLIIDVGDIVEIKYYSKGRYIVITGIIKNINKNKKIIVLENGIIIKFNDILKVKIIR